MRGKGQRGHRQRIEPRQVVDSHHQRLAGGHPAEDFQEREGDGVPVGSAALRDLRHDVLAVAERGELRAMTDQDIFAWATAQGRWLLSENVKDFRPILLRALQADTAVTGILYTSSRAFPRSRKNPGPLIHALNAWLKTGPPAAPLTEDWLLNPADPAVRN